MLYRLDDFPVKTKESTIDVVLPEGSYVFELIVEDSAGLRSLPDRVVIIVKSQKPDPPIITRIVPRFALLGEAVSAVIYGKNLQYTEEILFLRGKKADDGIKVTIPGGQSNDESITIHAQVDANCELGSRPFRVVTSGGARDSGVDVRFRVVDKPAIAKVLPPMSNPGETTKMFVNGINLFLEGEPASDHHVDFFLQGIPARGTIVAEVQEESTPDKLVVSVTVDPKAKTGEYMLQVTTPAGHIVRSPHTFKVT